MNNRSQDVVITGIGLVSSAGEGIDAHWNALAAGRPIVDADRFAPYPVHPLPEIDWSTQIPKRGDLRQMDTWQRLGVHAAGLALEDAGLRGDEQRCGSMDMTVSAGGGARDLEVDAAILQAAASAEDPEINRILTTELRPTLFLAQLSNLLAGNISIVHKVTGSSRTFMGEEGGSISAIEQAVARIRNGQSTHALVGGAHICETPDFLLIHALGGLLHEGPWMPLWERRGAAGGGLIEGSGSAFLVLENREHAEGRGARIYARIGSCMAGQAARSAGYAEGLAQMFAAATGDKPVDLVLSAASGAHAATERERWALEKAGVPFRGISAIFGHVKEAQLPFAVALAAIIASKGEAPAPLASGEAAVSGAVHSVLATAVGMTRAEGAACVTRAD